MSEKEGPRTNDVVLKRGNGNGGRSSGSLRSSS